MQDRNPFTASLDLAHDPGLSHALDRLGRAPVTLAGAVAKLPHSTGALAALAWVCDADDALYCALLDMVEDEADARGHGMTAALRRASREMFTAVVRVWFEVAP